LSFEKLDGEIEIHIYHDICIYVYIENFVRDEHRLVAHETIGSQS
jgi:hypothetical protein